MQEETPVAQEISPGIFECEVHGQTWMLIDLEAWLANGTPRWTPERGHEVLAESRIGLPGHSAKLRIQAYVG